MAGAWRLAAIYCLCLAACASDSSPTDPGEGNNGENPPAPMEREGHIFVENRTDYPLEIAYLDRRQVDDWQIVRLRYAPGQRQRVSDRVWPAGFEIELDAALVLPAEVGFRVRRKAKLVVDGDVELVFSLEDDDPFSAHFSGI